MDAGYCRMTMKWFHHAMWYFFPVPFELLFPALIVNRWSGLIRTSLDVAMHTTKIRPEVTPRFMFATTPREETSLEDPCTNWDILDSHIVSTTDFAHRQHFKDSVAKTDAVSQPSPCSKSSSFLQPPPAPPLSNSLFSDGHHHQMVEVGHHHMMEAPHHQMLPPPSPHAILGQSPHPMLMDHAPHHPMMTPFSENEYHELEDDHDFMRPTDFLMEGIQKPFMGLMKILNPLNIINRFRG
ncbi:hypothetical protein SK128_026437 [Halocaridina rubra]|uniref:Uncharacterized protein n=1 Tax=Halocaridina rubra TaxID=373956 RepID=A0AAN8WDB2_HALRR